MSSKEPELLPIPTSYPTWLIAFVAPDEASDQLKMQQLKDSSNAAYTNTQLSNREPSAHSGTNLYPHHTALTIPPDTDTAVAIQTAQQNEAQKDPKDKQKQKQKKKPSRLRTRAEQDEHDRESIVKFLRRLFAEFVGTFIFVFLVAGVALEFNLTGNAVEGLRNFAALNQAGCGLASGLTLSFLIYAMGQISGAHFNPCITWSDKHKRTHHTTHTHTDYPSTAIEY